MVYYSYAMKTIKLTIYDTTHNLLNGCRLPFGMNLTKFINVAMCEKLERDEGSASLGSLPPVPKEKQPIDPRAILDEMKKHANPQAIGPYTLYHNGDTQYLVALKEHKNLGDRSPGVESILEQMHIRDNYGVLSEERKRAIMAEHEEKLQAKARQMAEIDPDAIPDRVKGNKTEYLKWRAEKDAERAGVKMAQENMAARGQSEEEFQRIVNRNRNMPVEESEDADFWGDESLTKVRASVKKYCK